MTSESATQASPLAANSSGSCSATDGDTPAGAGLVSLFMLAAPLIMLAWLKYRPRRWPYDWQSVQELGSGLKLVAKNPGDAAQTYDAQFDGEVRAPRIGLSSVP